MAEQGFEVRLTARIDGYLSAMAQAKKATKEVADGVDFDRLGGKMHDVGHTLSKSVTLPLIAVGGIAVKMSSDFEGAFGRMVGLAGVTADEVDGLKEAVLDLAGETGQAPQDLADGLYFLRSSGLDSAKAMDALKQSAMASTAGLGSTAVIADAVSSAMNAYAKSGLSAAEATDILVGTARAGKAEPVELAGALGRVLPIAAELGITFEDVGGAIAALSLSGNDASTSATLLQNVMSKLLKPSQQGAEALANVGMSAASIRASIADQGLLATLEDLKTRLGDAGFVKFLEDAQAVQGALALTGQNAEQVHKVFDGVASSTGATSEAFGAMAETSGFKMKKAWADVQVALIQAGDIIMPIVAGVAGAIGNLASAFADLPGPAQTVIVAFLGLVAAAGPLLMIGGSLIRNLKEVRSVMSGLGSGASAAVGPLAILGVAVYGLSQRASHAKDEIRKIGEAAQNLSTVADAQVMTQLWQAISQGVIAGQDLTLTMKQLAEANVLGARRALEMAEAQGADERIIVALRRAVVDKMHADDEATTATDRLTGSTDELAKGESILQAAVLGATGQTDALKAVQEEATRKSDAFAASLQTQIDKLAELYPKQYDAVKAKYDYRDAVEETMLKVADLDTTLGDHKATQEDVRSATLTARDAILDQATKFATLDGAAAGSEGAIRRQISSLEAQRDSLAPGSPLRAFLDEYIADLKEIPSNISTIMDLHISSGQVTTAAGDIIGQRTGKRASGGPVLGGGIYEVAEGGRPEMYAEGGKRYLLPGGDGVVTPFSPGMPAMNGGSVSAPVTYQGIVHNNGRDVTIEDVSRALAMARLAA